ncbi:conserved hypothetical protein [Neisseria gonorrhoeae DGI2]|nr:conserved hypothetical protein [Neisseria gonorrhoeae DGI2]
MYNNMYNYIFLIWKSLLSAGCMWQIGYNRRIFSLSDGIAAVRTFL